ncbi:MAG: hypothetical protein CM15mP55_2150 [Hyphomicrobiales bacterium]|nr:MAG: hypothetical protein CM15mP55_2150 [Hyphomicrobiales bacterium]
MADEGRALTRNDRAHLNAFTATVPARRPAAGARASGQRAFGAGLEHFAQIARAHGGDLVADNRPDGVVPFSPHSAARRSPAHDTRTRTAAGQPKPNRQQKPATFTPRPFHCRRRGVSRPVRGRQVEPCLSFDCAPHRRLVADDRVRLVAHENALYAEPPARLAGLMEVRGIGILRMDYLARAQLDLAVELVAADAVPRIAEPHYLESRPSPAAHPSACV